MSPWEPVSQGLGLRTQRRLRKGSRLALALAPGGGLLVRPLSVANFNPVSGCPVKVGGPASMLASPGVG